MTRKALLALATATAIGAGAWLSSHHVSEETARECVALDGDTLACRGGLRLRLNGIDAPELAGHCPATRHCAPGDPLASKTSLQRAVSGHFVHYRVLKIDRYGRLVVEASTASERGQIDLSCWQLATGQAIYKGVWDEHKLVADCK